MSQLRWEGALLPSANSGELGFSSIFGISLNYDAYSGNKQHSGNFFMGSPDRPDSIAKAMEMALQTAFSPIRMTLADDSDKHKGHAGHDGQGESHFRLLIVSDAFEGVGRLDRHRMIHKVLELFLSGRVHAMAIRALAPEEDGMRNK
jgi:BolA protein